SRLGAGGDRFAHPQPMGFPGGEWPRIGSVGRLEPVKGLDVLLDAFAVLKNPSASLVIAGDGSECARLQARIGPLASRVHIIPPIAHEHMPAFLKGLDILVLPS